jgi:hypothetical protein
MESEARRRVVGGIGRVTPFSRGNQCIAATEELVEFGQQKR